MNVVPLGHRRAGHLLAALSEFYGLPTHDPRVISNAARDLQTALDLAARSGKLVLTADMRVQA